MSVLPSAEEFVWETSDVPAAADSLFIDESLESFNTASADLAAVRPLGCFARLPTGRIVGGAIGRTWGRCCELRQLWVEEAYRRRGIGTRLVRLIEARARDRGCRVIFLETFSFQAPDLYRRLGYEVACQIEGFPDGITKFLLRKSLA
jgi:GNAT superfamily N-acetyltransferase